MEVKRFLHFESKKKQIQKKKKKTIHLALDDVLSSYEAKQSVWAHRLYIDIIITYNP